MLLGFAIGPILSLTCCLSSEIKFSLPSSVPIKETKAAIASKLGSEIYNLEILGKDIQDNKEKFKEWLA